jgi:hypothetical protein
MRYLILLTAIAAVLGGCAPHTNIQTPTTVDGFSDLSSGYYVSLPSPTSAFVATRSAASRPSARCGKAGSQRCEQTGSIADHRR